MVEDIPLGVWGLCFGKVGGVISCLFGHVREYRWLGPQCLRHPPVSASSIYKTMVLAYGAVRGTAPQYLQALIRPYTQTSVHPPLACSPPYH